MLLKLSNIFALEASLHSKYLCFCGGKYQPIDSLSKTERIVSSVINQSGNSIPYRMFVDFH